MADKKAPVQESTPQAEREAALQRGVAQDQLAEVEKNTVWVVSNRLDDVVVLWEQDPRHPGGEAFIGGSTPDHVYRTKDVNKALYDQLAKVVEAPVRTLVHPITGEEFLNPVYLMQEERADDRRGLPGQPILLGRELETRHWTDAQLERMAARDDGGRKEIPSEATVPSDNPNERRT